MATAAVFLTPALTGTTTSFKGTQEEEANIRDIIRCSTAILGQVVAYWFLNM